MTANEEDKRASDNCTQSPSDFSIDHILNRAGTSTAPQCSHFEKSPNHNLSIDTYSWLQCTRYCPPKVPNLKGSQRRGFPQKRQLGRHPRIPFSNHQLSVLEKKFQQSPYLSSEEVIALANELQLADVRVKIWFQNRRARERREKVQTVVSSETVNVGKSQKKDLERQEHLFSQNLQISFGRLFPS